MWVEVASLTDSDKLFEVDMSTPGCTYSRTTN